MAVALRWVGPGPSVADFSQIKAALESLKNQGVTDFRSHLQQRPEFVWDLVRTIRVLDVNNASLALYGATSKEQLLGNLDRILLPENQPMLLELMVAIAEGRSRFECETVNRSLDGKVLNILVRLILPKVRKSQLNW